MKINITNINYQSPSPAPGGLRLLLPRRRLGRSRQRQPQPAGCRDDLGLGRGGLGEGDLSAGGANHGKTTAKSDGKLENPGKIPWKIGTSWQNPMKNWTSMGKCHGKCYRNGGKPW